MEFLASPEFQKALGTVILVIVGTLAAALTRNASSFIRQKATEQQIRNLDLIARTAVLAVEQLGLNGTVNDKKQSAINLVQVWLTQLGVTGVTAQQIDAAIEAAVYDNLNFGAAPEEANGSK